MKKIVLFDIDGTLIEQNEIIDYSFSKATENILGIKIHMTGTSIFGKTDSQIISSIVLRNANNPTKKLEQSIKKEYIKIYKNSIPNFNLKTCVGIPKLLDRLSNAKNCILGLLSGNFKELIKPKFEFVSINFSIFKVGVFGNDSQNRNDLPLIALRRINNKLSMNFGTNSLILIGDTPYDIECARKANARIISIASGKFKYEILDRYSPDFIFYDATDVENIEKAIFI